MKPLTLLAIQKLQAKFIANDALSQQIVTIAQAAGVSVPTIASAQVTLSPAPADLADKNMQLTYPRVCIYSTALKNTQIEKFRVFSGQISLTVEIWASGVMVGDIDQAIHFYVEAAAEILQTSIGDWGDGMFYSGMYEVQFQPPKTGGFGFVESAKLSFALNASVS